VQKGALGGGGISYPGAEHPLSYQGLLISGLPHTEVSRFKDARKTTPIQRLYPRGGRLEHPITGAGLYLRPRSLVWRGHPFEAAYMEPRVCAHAYSGGTSIPMGATRSILS
jgi:hypothetical protein